MIPNDHITNRLMMHELFALSLTPKMCFGGEQKVIPTITNVLELVSYERSSA